MLPKLTCALVLLAALTAVHVAAGRDGLSDQFPHGTFRTKITPADLWRARLSTEDAD
jgi:hypothetical protein